MCIVKVIKSYDFYPTCNCYSQNFRAWQSQFQRILTGCLEEKSILSNIIEFPTHIIVAHFFCRLRRTSDGGRPLHREVRQGRRDDRR